MASNTNKTDDLDFHRISIMSATGKKMIEQMNSIEDPVVRYSLFFQFIKFLSEFGITFISKTNEEKLDDLKFELELLSDEIDEMEKTTNIDSANERKQKIRKQRELKRKVIKLSDADNDLKYISENTTIYLEGFNKWIYQPVYSPDHPCGKLMMDTNKQQFDKRNSNSKELEKRSDK